ncbi:MAG: hydrogenase nickel incorporation protein HypB [Planctomycetota bacterium]
MTIPIIHQAPRRPHAARENRKLFDAAGTICLNLLGAPASGKTALLAAILPRLTREVRVGVIEAGLASTADAQRLEALGVPVVQLLTDGRCHVAAEQVRHALHELPLSDLDLLIIENTGGLPCQALTDLGEHVRATTLSVSQGHAVVGKYPLAFSSARLILVTKYDLLPHTDFDLDGTVRQLGRISPGAEVVCTDTRRRLGTDRVAGWLLGYVRAQLFRRPLSVVTEATVDMSTGCLAPQA